MTPSRRRLRVISAVASVVLAGVFIAGLITFFATPMSPTGTLETLDKKASVASMIAAIIGLPISLTGLLLQLRPPSVRDDTETTMPTAEKPEEDKTPEPPPAPPEAPEAADETPRQHSTVNINLSGDAHTVIGQQFNYGKPPKEDHDLG